jgi:type IV pilus assembly protein PilN
MMRINLLPMKAARKQGTAKQELTLLVAALLVLVACLFGWYTLVESQVSDLQDRVANVQRELEAARAQVQRVTDFKRKAEVLEKKIAVIETLKKKKTGPAKMLDDLATIFTEHKKVWIVRMDERDGNLTIEGGAMEHENISDFQLALTRRSTLFQNIKLGVVEATKKDGVDFLTWRMTCTTSYAPG